MLPANTPDRQARDFDSANCAIRSLSLVLIFITHQTTSRGDESIDFARDVRPILSENCSFCHGPDDQQREADLRLDTSDGAWSVIDKGSSSTSELYQRLISDDMDTVMPPPESNRELSEEQVEILRRWIDQGASWEDLWSFQPIKKPAIPLLREDSTYPVHNPIDQFIQGKLESSELSPSEQAPRHTLIRRLSLDLTGLPPTPEQTAAFLHDSSPKAYEELVDRLLESKHYGERMAWEWLDAARYADTNGYQGDGERTMWPWRDWVVDAFNQNLPYDQFTLWQIAGDLLPNSTHDQKLATAFNRNHMINGEGGRIAEENRVEYVMDMTETMGTIWLGMTLNCCRCHDHKYDPLLNDEYYRFFAFFNQTGVNGGGGNAQTPPVLASPSNEQKQSVEKLERQRDEKSKQLEQRGKDLAALQADWEQETIKRLATAPTWSTMRVVKMEAAQSDLMELDDGSILARTKQDVADPAKNDTYRVTFNGEGKQTIAAVRLEVMRHESFQNSLSHADSGNFVLTEFEIRTVDKNGSERSEAPLKIASSEATFEQGTHKISAAFDGAPNTGWAVYEGGRVSKDHAAVFRIEPAIQLGNQQQLEITLAHDSVHEKHNIGRFRISTSNQSDLGFTDSNAELLTALNINSAVRTAEQNSLIQKAHRESDGDYQRLTTELQNVSEEIKRNRNSWPKVMVMADQSELRKTFILERGLYNQPKQEVSAGFPVSILKAAPSTSQETKDSTTLTRLDLAQWLIHPDHPLTARVTVNRFWQQFFGVGLVKTTEDFGAQGETPVHLELLNWLARDFIDSGWDIKALVRLIVTSHTYRQSSIIPSSDMYELDPENRLLSRAPRYRLPAWMIRDQALAASGLLSNVTDGPSVNTYQPEGVWEEASFGKKQYRQDAGEKLYRRSLYVFWRRIIAPTMFFDNASRQTCTVRSGRTNTPLHALQTLNGTTYVEAARKLASWCLTQPIEADQTHPQQDEKGLSEVTDAYRINLVLNRLLARNANEREQAILQQGLNRSREQFSRDGESAVALISVGESTRDESILATEHAAWTSLCLAVLNLDETLNRE